jgi:hypothetical protein
MLLGGRRCFRSPSLAVLRWLGRIRLREATVRPTRVTLAVVVESSSSRVRLGPCLRGHGRADAQALRNGLRVLSVAGRVFAR